MKALGSSTGWKCPVKFRMLDKYAIFKFAESFEVVPKTLAENVGLKSMEIIASLYTGHGSRNTKLGIDFEEGVVKTSQIQNYGIFIPPSYLLLSWLQMLQAPCNA